MTSIHSFLPAPMVSGISLILIFVILSIAFRKMDVPGGITGGIIALSLFWGGGFPMLFVLVAFFILGVGASHWKKEYKTNIGLAQENKGIRSVRHAIANGGAAAIYALCAGYSETRTILFLAMSAACLAAATSDTLSSEIGNVWGKKYIHIISLKRDDRGKDGVVSLEGTAAGIMGSVIIGGVFYLGFGHITFAVWIVIAGIVGNIVDSLLGATLQQKNILSNDHVNFICTLIAGLSIWGFFALWGG